MSQREPVTRAMALPYRAASKQVKGQMLDELLWLVRDHARKTLRQACRPALVGRRRDSAGAGVWGGRAGAATEKCGR